MLAPNMPTAVAWELPDISVLMAKNVGHPMLMNAIPTRATPTVPQAVMSKENSSQAARPPTTAQPATIWARRLMAATDPAMTLPITTPMPTIANGIAVSPTLNSCSLIRYAGR